MKINAEEEASLGESKSTPEISSNVDKPSPLLEKNETRTLIKNLIKETIGNETSQAIIRMFDTESVGLKLFWFICLLGCGSLAFFSIIQTLVTYLSYSVYTTTSIVHEESTLFPKITICNSAAAVTEHAYDLVREINEKLYPNVSIFNRNQMRNIGWNESSKIIFNVINAFQSRINSPSFSDASRKKLAHSFEDVLIKCIFMGRPCSSSDFTWQWDAILFFN